MSSPSASPAQSLPNTINYAHFLGFESVAAAIIFAVAYIPLLVWFIIQSFRIPTYVHYVLVFFCTIRIAAFTIRAILAGIEKAGETLGLVIADEILIGVGFFGLLYSAYTLVINREELLPPNRPPKHIIIQIASRRRLFRLSLLAGVVLGVVAASNSGSNFQNNTSNALRKVSVVIFLVLTVIQALLTLNLAMDERAYRNEGVGRPQTNQRLLSFNAVPLNDVEGRAGSAYQRPDTLSSDAESVLGKTYGIYVLLIISLLLLVREAFSIATIGKQVENERLWYPLTALPEILAVALYATPGLVPHAK